VVGPTVLAALAPAPGAYFGGATTTITGVDATAANVTCTVSDGSVVLGSTSVTVGGGGNLSAAASVQLGVFTSTGTALDYSCSSDQPDAASATNTVFAGLSLDAIPATP
jgi:hypothetical protein